MSNNNAFFSEQKFTATEFFPYGIGRSGNFSVGQVLLLEQHGHAYKALHSGHRAPINAEEK